MGQNTKCVIITDGRVLTGRQNISATLDWVAIFAGPLRSQSGNKTLIAGSDLHGRLISTGNKTTTTYYRNFPAGPGCWLVVLLFYVHGKHLRSCRDGQLT